MIGKMMITALAVGLTVGVTADEKVKIRKQLSSEQKTKLAAIKANKSSNLEGETLSRSVRRTAIY